MSTRLIATPFFLATLLESVLAFPTGSALAAENYCESALSINEFSSWQFNYQFDAAKIQKFFDQTESSLSVTDLNTGRTEVIANQADPLADSYFRSPDCRWIVIASQDVIYDLKNRTFKPFAFIDSAPLVTFPHNQATTAYLTYSEKDKISVVRLDLDTGMTRLQFQTSSSNPELISFDLVDDGVVVHNGPELIFIDFTNNSQTRLTSDLELPYYLPVAFSRENMKLAFSGTSRIDYFSINPEAQPSTLGSAYEMPRRRNSSRPRRNSRIVLRGTGDVSTFEMNLKSGVRRQVVGFPNKFEREAVSPLYYPLNEVISAIFYESHSDSLCAAFNNSLFVEDPKSFVVTEKKLESSTEFLIDPTVGLFSSSREAGQTRPRYFSSETNLLLFESAVDYPSAYSESNGLLDLSTANPRDYFLTKSVRGQSNRGAELFELYFNHGLSSSRPFVFDQADNKNSKRTFFLKHSGDIYDYKIDLYTTNLVTKATNKVDEVFNVNKFIPLEFKNEYIARGLPVADPEFISDQELAYVKMNEVTGFFELWVSTADAKIQEKLSQLEMDVINFPIALNKIKNSNKLLIRGKHGFDYSFDTKTKHLIKMPWINEGKIMIGMYKN